MGGRSHLSIEWTFPAMVKEGQRESSVVSAGSAGCWDHRTGDLHGVTASAADPTAVLDFWKAAAEGTSISDDPAGVERLHARDPHALLPAFRDGEPVGTVIAGFDGRCHL